MDKQLILNVLISLIIGISVSYYYLQQFNVKFIFYSFVIFLISFIIFHFLGKKDIDVESFFNAEEMKSESLAEMNSESLAEMNSEFSSEMNGESLSEMNGESLSEMNGESLEEEEYNQEEILNNQEEILNNQEEYIRQSIEEEEIEEEDNNDSIKKKIAKAKLLSDNSLFGKSMHGNNNQFNPGIGIGVSPVNIYINGTEVDKFNNGKDKKKHKEKKPEQNNCSDNYFKKASRIYNNCDWIKDKKDWCNESYNYDKNCGKTNELLPCSKVPVTNIPQTLNNLVNSKKTIENGEPCPLEINTPWSNYKTGDSKEKDEIVPDGFNL